MSTQLTDYRLDGIYRQRQDGFLMQRIKLAAGVFSSDQARAIAAASTRFGQGTILPLLEVTNISYNEIWLLIDTGEMFLSFEPFPWFQEASINKILYGETPSENHLF